MDWRGFNSDGTYWLDWSYGPCRGCINRYRTYWMDGTYGTCRSSIDRYRPYWLHRMDGAYGTYRGKWCDIRLPSIHR